MKLNYHPEADTRTMEEVPSYEELLKANYDHIQDIKQAAKYFVSDLMDQIDLHDADKITECDIMLKDMQRTKEGENFTDLSWYTIHKHKRHHRVDWDKCFEDITMVDVLENLFDKLVAYIARRGECTDRDIEIFVDSISGEKLRLALINTLRNLL